MAINTGWKASFKYLKFYRYLLPLWKIEVAAILLGLVIMLLGLVNPYLSKLVIDKAYVNRDLRLFIILFCAGGGIFILTNIASMVNLYLDNYIRLKVGFNLNKKLFRKLLYLHYGFFQDSSTGENLYKINYDIERAAGFITGTLPQLISLLPKAVFVSVIVLCMSWRMVVLTLALMPFLYIVPYYYTKRKKKNLRELIGVSQGIFKQLHEMLSRIQLIKAFGKERYEKRRYAERSIEKVRISFKNTRLEMNNMFANNLVSRAILGLVAFYGGYQLIKGRMTLGTLAAVTIYLRQLLGLQGAFAGFFQQLSLNSVSCERLDSVLEAQPELMEDKYARELIFPRGKIEFNNITFGYLEGKRVLDDLSLCIEGGSCIGLVGSSGYGKSTIVNLLLRLYNLNSGQILVDGHNIKDIKSASLYGQIGIVLQEPYLWNDTVENNIRYGKLNATFDEIKRAAEIACADKFIDNLPKKYDTVIGENACKISEGQKQRIAIARAIIKLPKILILDEALSSVDAQIEAEIIDNIRALLKNTTLIVVSHRLSAIKRMNCVFFLNSRKKIDIGRHEELARDNLEYQDYLSYQLKT